VVDLENYTAARAETPRNLGEAGGRV